MASADRQYHLPRHSYGLCRRWHFYALQQTAKDAVCDWLLLGTYYYLRPYIELHVPTRLSWLDWLVQHYVCGFTAVAYYKAKYQLQVASKVHI